MGKDDASWLNISYLVFWVVAGYVVSKAVDMLGVQMGWVERFEWFAIATTAISVAVGGGLTWWLRSSAERHEYFLSAIGEFRKVSFPTWIDTRKMTVIVVIVVGIFAVILSSFDYIWSMVLRQIIS